MSKSSKAPKSARRRLRGEAARADRHELYERAVQEPDSEVEFLSRVFQQVRGRAALSLREDFCGTAVLCSEWVRSAPQRRAIGVDLDRETLDSGLGRRAALLGPAADRVQLLCADVREVDAAAVDIVVAMNFSYSLIHERRELVRYFEHVRDGLLPDGLFVLDFHAGPRSQEEIEEDTEFEDFVYVWEQGEMDALSGLASRAIHFEFPDGSELANAFRYEFRIWTVPELRDALDDAGFGSHWVYYEDFDHAGNTLGPARKVKHLTHEDSWIGYLVAHSK